MPNLVPPVTTTAHAFAYRDRILASLPSGATFTPLMTLYLTDQTTGEEVRAAKASGIVHALKMYPAGATTNSAAGVTDVANVAAALEAMQEVGLPLCVHSEVVTPSVDIFDRESVFIEQVFKPLLVAYPRLKFVMEHITTKEGVEFVMAAGPNVGGTITAHHLLYNRNALLVGGIKPHLYCLPILKAEDHRQALLGAVASGTPKLFLGTDSAPHGVQHKESACGCAGVFTAHAALPLYAEAFESVGALGKLEAFASHHGPAFYGLPRNSETGRKLVLTRAAVPVPEAVPFGPGELKPLRGGQTVAWAVEWRESEK